VLALLLLVISGLIVAQSNDNTLPPAKDAIEQQYAQERAAGTQNPAPKDPNAPFPIVEEVPFPVGIIDDADGPFGAEELTISNRWQGIRGGVRTLVYAGALTAEPTQGFVIVMTLPDYPNEPQGQRVLTPVPTGPIRVVAEQDGILTLVSSSYLLKFDIDKREFILVLLDTTPPTIAGMPTAGCSLWPPNNSLKEVATITATDAGSGIAPNSFIVTGASNEPNDPKSPDIVITPNEAGGFRVQLRAARLGSGNGRIYTLTARASDLVGNTTTLTAQCVVPHDQR